MAQVSGEPSTSSTSGTCKKSSRSVPGAEYGNVLDGRTDKALIQALKHIDTFYVKKPDCGREEERPEDAIPDEPQNFEAREFLAKAPKKGLWMPLGKEVKVMQCWKCKAFGHRSGDRECPLFFQGSLKTEQFRFMQEDPMFDYVKSQTKDKEEKVKQLQALLKETTSEEDSSDQHGKDKKRKRKKSKKDKKRSRGKTREEREGKTKERERKTREERKKWKKDKKHKRTIND